jgi:AcrR family transcriptional regulator
MNPQTQMSSNMDPRTVRSRQALHRAFLELLEHTPIDRITIRDIAAQSGVGYTTFFRHHPSKEAMLSEIVHEQIAHFLSLAVPVLDAGDIKAASTAIFRYVDEHRALWTTLLTGGAAATVREEFLRLARDVAAERLPKGKWVPADIGLALIVSGTIELLTLWLRQSDPLPIKRIVDIYTRIIVMPPMEANRFDVRTGRSRKAPEKVRQPTAGNGLPKPASRKRATRTGQKGKSR